MPIPKKFLHDKLVLLLLSIMGFLVLLSSVLILFRLDSSQEAYFIQFRENQGLDAFRTGGTLAMLNFIFFAVLIGVIHVVISMRIYKHRRDIAIMMLSLGILLGVMNIIVSNALLVSGT